jgi:hypothetical protein
MGSKDEKRVRRFKRWCAARVVGGLCLLGGVVLLCGCKSSLSLGERAIVKAIYLDTCADGRTQAALVVYTCEPTADTSAAQGEARIYCAIGDDAADALRLAERKQNKKPFYGQNRILLLGPNAAQTDVTPYLRYLGQENASYADLGVFVTSLTAQELLECEDSVGVLVREGERLFSTGALAQQPACRLSELQMRNDKVQGWLPVLQLSEQGESAGVDTLLLIEEGRAAGVVQGDEVQLALLLAGKGSALSLNIQLNGQQLACETGYLQVDKWAELYHGAPHLYVTVQGRVRAIRADGEALRGTQAEEAVAALNAWIEQQLTALYRATFCRGNDAFRWVWWLRQCDANAVGDMESTGDLFNLDCVHLSSALSAPTKRCGRLVGVFGVVLFAFLFFAGRNLGLLAQQLLLCIGVDSAFVHIHYGINELFFAVAHTIGGYTGAALCALLGRECPLLAQ